MISTHISRPFVVVLLAAMVPIVASGRTDEMAWGVGGPLTLEPVLGAPFSADASATFTQTRRDGTLRQYTTTARYYRDSAGSVRIEQTIMDLDLVKPANGSQTLVVIADPHKKLVTTVDAVARAIRHLPRSMFAAMFDGMSRFDVPVSPIRFEVLYHRDRRAGFAGTVVKDENLGSRRIEGLETIGRRVTTELTDGTLAQIIDERWTSPALQLVIYGRTSDSRKGVLELRVTNINRGDQPEDLFTVPDGYITRGLSVFDPASAMHWRAGDGKK